MNQYAKELQLELDTLAKKYRITKGVMFFEEVDVNNKEKLNHRVLIFSPEATAFNPHEFGQLYMACLKVSKTFRTIVNHFAEHIVKLIDNQVVDTMLREGGLERAD